MLGDSVPLSKVAEAMARHKTTGGGALPWRKATFLDVRPKYERLLIDAATKGTLRVCNQFGFVQSINEIVDKDRMAKLNQGTPEINSLFVKISHLKEWGETNGDVFRIEDVGHEVFLVGDALGLLEMQAGPTKNTKTPVPESELDYSLLATRKELIDVFGNWGLKAAWFEDLNSRKWLLGARRKKGQGQKGQVIEPMFCPFAVMNGLIQKGRIAKRLQPDTAWRILKHKFPRVYDAFESHDPRDLTGD
jgi:hypothetical protein